MKLISWNVNGIRACKLVKGLETRYITQNNQIICEENNNGIIIYQYVLNKLVGFTYTTSSGTKKYLYIRNIRKMVKFLVIYIQRIKKQQQKVVVRSLQWQPLVQQ